MSRSRARIGVLGLVPGRDGPPAAELVSRIETRIDAACRELEGIRAELVRLAELSAPGRPDVSPVPPRLLTVGQAAAALGLGESTVHGLIRSGALGSRKIGGARRVGISDLDEFVERGRSSEGEPTSIRDGGREQEMCPRILTA